MISVGVRLGLIGIREHQPVCDRNEPHGRKLNQQDRPARPADGVRTVDHRNSPVGTLDNAGEIIAAVLSPLVLVAFGMRIVVAGLAFALAYPLTRWNQPTDYAHGRKRRSWIRLWSDRWHLTRAYRALRWTWAVRQVAAERLGELGQQLVRCGPVLRWASIVLFIVYLVTIILTVEP